MNSKYFDISYSSIEQAVIKHSAQSWFLYAYKDFNKRYHVKKPLEWIKNNLAKESVVFENGCGAGINLLWLHEQGFKNLQGTDNDPAAINAAKEIVNSSGYSIAFEVDNGINPQTLNSNSLDVIISLNWTYHAPEFDLQSFVKKHSQYLRDGGYMIFDCIDSSYNNTPNNQYKTQDWKKPIDQRRTTEYISRYSIDEVKSICAKSELEVLHVFSKNELIKKLANVILRKYTIVPRNIFIAHKK